MREWNKGDDDIRPMQFGLSAASHLLDHTDDLISLHPPSDEDWTAKIVAGAFKNLLIVRFLATLR